MMVGFNVGIGLARFVGRSWGRFDGFLEAFISGADREAVDASMMISCSLSQKPVGQTLTNYTGIDPR